MSDKRSGAAPRNFFGNPAKLTMAAALVAAMILIPLPTPHLDALMAMNMALALMILLAAFYAQKATGFSIFPRALLVSTVFSLALNVSAARLILTQGAAFNGRMIRAVSAFVAGSGGTGGLVAGFVSFIVIIAVQAMVITKGAARIAEVAARFALDALPAKQMVIDADQALTGEESRARKDNLQKELDFYGSMEGAQKFISGSVKAGILITAVTILGGTIIGAAIRGEPIAAAMGTCVAFSIGSGLLFQFPALLASAATGIIVTRPSSNSVFGA
jgi:flagellar biosynthesis protein FlhA